MATGQAFDGVPVGPSAHDRAVLSASESVGLPTDSLAEAIAEARVVGRHRLRAVPARRIDEMVSELRDLLRPKSPGSS